MIILVLGNYSPRLAWPVLSCRCDMVVGQVDKASPLFSLLIRWAVSFGNSEPKIGHLLALQATGHETTCISTLAVNHDPFQSSMSLQLVLRASSGEHLPHLTGSCWASNRGRQIVTRFILLPLVPALRSFHSPFTDVTQLSRSRHGAHQEPRSIAASLDLGLSILGPSRLSIACLDMSDWAKRSILSVTGIAALRRCQHEPHGSLRGMTSILSMT